MPLSKDLRWKCDLGYTVRCLVDAKTDAYARRVAKKLRDRVDEIIEMAMAERKARTEAEA